MKLLPSLLVCAVVSTLGIARAAISVAGSSTLWTAIPGNYDFLADHQTGQPAGDIVGAGTHAGFFVAFDDNGSASHSDGTLGFRLRLDAPGGNANSPAFDRVAWVGIDADGNGTVDAFIGVSAQGNSTSLGIYAPGDSENISPKTTSISASPTYSYNITATNYNYRAVDFTSDGGTSNDLTAATSGDPDYYLSFAVPFADLVAYLGFGPNQIADQLPLRYVIATSTQHNSLNQDLGGINGGIGSISTWESLGGFTSPVNASGTVVPEASSFTLAAFTLGLVALRRRRW